MQEVGRVERIYVTGGRNSRRIAQIQVYGAHPTTCQLSAAGLAVGQNLDMVVLPSDPRVCGRAGLGHLIGPPGLGFLIAAALVLGSVYYYDRHRRAQSAVFR